MMCMYPPREVWNHAMFLECGKLAMPVMSSLRATSVVVRIIDDESRNGSIDG